MDSYRTNAASFRAGAAELRRLAETPRYRRYAIAHRQMADSLDAQSAALDAASSEAVLRQLEQQIER